MSGFQDRTGCPNKITTIREKFGECFDKLGGVDALHTWAKKNPKSFYTMYGKMASKEIKMENTNRSHEQFIELMRMEGEQRKLEEGKPSALIDVPDNGGKETGY